MKKNWILALLMCMSLGLTSALAQGSAQIKSIMDLNNKINTGIAKDDFFVHRLNLNSFGKLWPGLSKYDENINCYFELDKDKNIILRKIVVISSIASRQSYADYVFDKGGSVTYCLYNHDTKIADSPKATYFFLKKQPVAISFGEETIMAEEFTNDDAQAAVEIMQSAFAYKAMFDAVAGVQLAPR